MRLPVHIVLDIFTFNTMHYNQKACRKKRPDNKLIFEEYTLTIEDNRFDYGEEAYFFKISD
jgi:hypothetical protein